MDEFLNKQLIYWVINEMVKNINEWTKHVE